MANRVGHNTAHYTLPSDLDKRMMAIIRSTCHFDDHPVDIRPDKRAECWYCRRETNTFTFRLASWARRDDEQVMERCGMMCLECGAPIADVCLRPVDALIGDYRRWYDAGSGNFVFRQRHPRFVRVAIRAYQERNFATHCLWQLVIQTKVNNGAYHLAAT